LRAIEVTLDDTPETGPPGVILWRPLARTLDGDDRTEWTGGTWFAETFPPEVCQNFVSSRSIPPMDGRSFLDVATDLAAGPTEAHWRAAAGRAYYALFHEGLAALRAGASPSLPARTCTRSPGSASPSPPIPT
jgi:hypothetical protein